MDNALWDLFAKSRKKPLWKLVVDFTPEEFVNATAFRYITDAITREEAVELLKAKAATKAEREARVIEVGYPAYVTSAGWLGACSFPLSSVCDKLVSLIALHFAQATATKRSLG